MSPALRGENIPRGVRPSIQRTQAGTGEVRLTCDRPGCDWSAVRPERAAPSAAEAHRIAHQKGMVS